MCKDHVRPLMEYYSAVRRHELQLPDTGISSGSSKIKEARFKIMYGRIPFLEPRKGSTGGKGN